MEYVVDPSAPNASWYEEDARKHARAERARKRARDEIARRVEVAKRARELVREKGLNVADASARAAWEVARTAGAPRTVAQWASDKLAQLAREHVEKANVAPVDAARAVARDHPALHELRYSSLAERPLHEARVEIERMLRSVTATEDQAQLQAWLAALR